MFIKERGNVYEIKRFTRLTNIPLPKIGDKLHFGGKHNPNAFWSEVTNVNNETRQVEIILLATFGDWAGSPMGYPEDRSLCLEHVTPQGEWIPRQCSRKRGYGDKGLYCKTHAKYHPAKEA